MNRLLSSLALVLLVALSSCKKDDDPTSEGDGNVILKLTLTDGSNQVYEGETISLQNNYDLKISLFRVFFSNIMFQNSNNEWKTFKDVVILDPGTTNGTDNVLSASLAPGSYKNLRFGLGVDSVMNEQEPSQYPNDHPLSAYQAMHWTMLKYRFAKFEGLANTSGQLGSPSDLLIAYHPGTNPLYVIDEVPVTFNLESNGNHTVELVLDINEMFAGSNPFDFTVENSTHSADAKQLELAAKFMNNLKASISLK